MTLCDGVSTFLLAVFSSYGVEIVGPSGRKYFGSLVGVAYALGFVLISVLAMYFPDRQLLTAVISGICLGFIILFSLMLFSIKATSSNPM